MTPKPVHMVIWVSEIKEKMLWHTHQLDPEEMGA